ncbi:MAG: NUDIX hydrolase [Candidatus Woesearchaeota archaeon]|jgi:ADP-ribose pyrophosphatase YjhB (NUDIX family)
MSSSEKNERHCTGIFIYKFNELKKEYEVALVQSEKFRHHSTGELLWTIPGGRIEPEDVGDTLEKRIIACAMREGREELRSEIQDVRYYPELNKKRKGAEIGYKDPEMQFYFYECVGKAVSDELKPGDDVIRICWYSLSQIQLLNMAEDVKGLLQEILTHTEKYFMK